jgi:hypothetical protein
VADHATDWVLAASSFNWTRDIMRAELSPLEIVTDIARSGVTRVVEVELGQCFRSFPRLSSDEVARMRDSLDERGARVSIAGLSLDDHVSLERRRTDEERLAFLEPQLRAAHTLGAHGIRLPFGQPGAQLIAALLPRLEELDLVLYQEIQGTQGPGMRGFDETMSALERDVRLRLLLDTSMVTPQLPVTYLDRLADSGVPEDLLGRVTSQWSHPETRTAVRECVGQGLVPPHALALFMTMVIRFGTWTVPQLDPLLPFVGAVHLKFWDLEDVDGRVTDPLRDLGAALEHHGFGGTLCSEWGGHDWYEGPQSATAMTQQHLELVRSTLGVDGDRPIGQGQGC